MTRLRSSRDGSVSSPSSGGEFGSPMCDDFQSAAWDVRLSGRPCCDRRFCRTRVDVRFTRASQSMTMRDRASAATGIRRPMASARAVCRPFSRLDDGCDRRGVRRPTGRSLMVKSQNKTAPSPRRGRNRVRWRAE
jgi:hypothetical protein